jgi:cell division protein FtsI (penicillin-binding protein 3)
VSTNKRKDVLWRIYLAFIGIALFGVAVLAKTMHTQVVQGAYWKSLADKYTIFTDTLEPERGNIYSEEGNLLATSLPFFDVRIDLASTGMSKDLFNSKVDTLSRCLADYFKDKTASEYRRDLVQGRKENNRYFLLKSNLSYPQLLAIKTFPLFKLGKYKSGLIIIQKNKRVMPFGNLAKRTIGFVGGDTVKFKVGIEGSFDESLTGVNGQVLVQKIAGGVCIPLNSDADIEPQSGKDIYTTINISLQDVAENALLKAVTHHKADWGTCILMEVKTGKIKAIANLTKTGDSNYLEQFNYALGERVEPGSTFKLASMIALLEDKLVTLNDTIAIEGGIHQFADRTMRDAEEHGLNKVSVKYCFAISSNVGISKMVSKYYKGKEELFYNHLTKLRLDKPTGIELLGEPTPKIRKPNEYSAVSLPWISVGYEQQITPLQMLTLYNTVANNGIAVKPYIVGEIKEFDKTISKTQSTIVAEQTINKEAIPMIKEMLEAVCKLPHATGTNLAKGAPYTIAGKTGTTKLLKNGKYEGGYNASFIGYFPAENPEYSCCVIISNPTENGYYGGIVAGPVFREIADKVYATSTNLHSNNTKADSNARIPSIAMGKAEDVRAIYKGLKIESDLDASSEWVQTTITNNKAILKERTITEKKVPNVKGLGLKDAIYILESSGLKVQVIGVGKVKQQSLTPGTSFNKGNTILITLG